jgi:hypothetical protein
MKDLPHRYPMWKWGRVVGAPFEGEYMNGIVFGVTTADLGV